ncbi:MAG: polyprenyl synthetase family protein [Chitinophagaceae bacterium]
MFTFQELTQTFSSQLKQQFSNEPTRLYEAANYFLELGGKRIRPVMCLMGNELFDNINPDAWHAANAIELFHNFTLVHDDIMDKASLRRGKPTVHEKYGGPTALLAGDLMLVQAYDYLNKIDNRYLHKIMALFNRTGKQVCEGQQSDMDFEQQENVELDAYINMIGLKTSVLLAASLQMGAILGGASLGNQQHLYEFGKNLGIAFQLQDDYLDAFGDPQKFGKEVGGDIKSNKKTFLVIRALEACSPEQKQELQQLMQQDAPDKVPKVLSIFKKAGIDDWARSLKEDFMKKALHHLDEIAVLSVRKEPLRQLAEYLMQRES